METRNFDHCFVCGSRNEAGLRLEIVFGDGEARAEFQPDARWEGYPGVVHGGVIGAMLDDLMFHAFYSVSKQLAVTALSRCASATRPALAPGLFCQGPYRGAARPPEGIQRGGGNAAKRDPGPGWLADRYRQTSINHHVPGPDGRFHGQWRCSLKHAHPLDRARWVRPGKKDYKVWRRDCLVGNSNSIIYGRAAVPGTR